MRTNLGYIAAMGFAFAAWNAVGGRDAHGREQRRWEHGWQFVRRSTATSCPGAQACALATGGNSNRDLTERQRARFDEVKGELAGGQVVTPSRRQ